eukprot:Awhi_evm1s12969
MLNHILVSLNIAVLSCQAYKLVLQSDNYHLLKYQWNEECSLCSQELDQDNNDNDCQLDKFVVFPQVNDCAKPVHHFFNGMESNVDFYHQIEEEFVDGEPMYVVKKYLDEYDNSCKGDFDIVDEVRISDTDHCWDNDEFGLHAFTITRNPLVFDSYSLDFPDDLPEDRVSESQASFFPEMDLLEEEESEEMA